MNDDATPPTIGSRLYSWLSLRRLPPSVAVPLLGALICGAAMLGFVLIKPGPSRTLWTAYNVLIALGAGALAATLAGVPVLWLRHRRVAEAIQAAAAVAALLVVYDRTPPFINLDLPLEGDPDLRMIAELAQSFGPETSREVLTALGYRWGAWDSRATLEERIDRASRDEAAARVLAARFYDAVGRWDVRIGGVAIPHFGLSLGMQGRYRAVHSALHLFVGTNAWAQALATLGLGQSTLGEVDSDLFSVRESPVGILKFSHALDESLATVTSPGVRTLEQLQAEVAAREGELGVLMRIETVDGGANRLKFRGHYTTRDSIRRGQIVLSIVTGEPEARPAFALAWSGDAYVAGTVRRVAVYRSSPPAEPNAR